METLNYTIDQFKWCLSLSFSHSTDSIITAVFSAIPSVSFAAILPKLDSHHNHTVNAITYIMVVLECACGYCHVQFTLFWTNLERNK